MNAPMVVQKSTAIAHTAEVVQLSPAQKKMIRESFMNGASDKEAEVLLMVAMRMQLDPFQKQIHFVPRMVKVGDKREERWSFQISLQGWRAIAERTGLYEGVSDPEWVEDPNHKGFPLSCTITAHRRDRERPAKYTARFAEFCQFTFDGKPTKMWNEKPYLMLEKCAEVNAIAKLFPEHQPSDLAMAMAEANIVQADFMADETAEPPPPKLPGQAEIVRDFLEAITACQSPDELKAISERIAATEIAKSDGAFLRDKYKAKMREFDKAKREAAKAPPAETEPMSDEETAAAVERGEA